MQATTATTARPISTGRASADHRFYVGSAIVSVAVVVAGFAPGLLDTSSRRGPLTPLAALHAATFTTWLILYLTQTLLASSGNLRLHRRLGVTAAILAPVMMLVGYRTTIEMVRRGFDLSGDLERVGPVIGNTSFQILGMPIFGGLVLAALLYRRRPDVHKRLMWLATVGLLGAPVAHLIGHHGLPLAVVPLANLLSLAAHPIYDRMAHGRFHPVSLWAGIGCLVLANILAVVAQHPTWQAFVLWLAS